MTPPHNEAARALDALRSSWTRTEAPQPTSRSRPVTAKAFDFATLPDFEQMKLQRAAADMIGIGSPFFRTIDAVEGSRVMIDGEERVQYGSYDYLGLNQDPRISDAVARATKTWGVSASASRVVGGERPFHREFERKLADVYGTEDALAFVSGHATNVSTIGSLMGPKDLVLIDALIHNSISEGVRLSGAQRLTFPHNDTDWLNRKLAETRHQYENVLIVTEGLYSMDGDAPNLSRLIDVKSRHKAWLMVDEAHALGVLGATGRGLGEAQGIDGSDVEIWMGTLSKTLCSCGGYIAGSSSLIEYLKFKAAGFVFSVGLSAPHAAAASTALDIMLAEPERVERLAANGARFLERAKAAGLDTGHAVGSAVAPVIVGDSIRTAILADRVFKRGVNALPIIFPAVPEKAARLRFFLTAMHSFDEIDEAVEITADELGKIAHLNLEALMSG
ncbi:MAG: aminotransferase class I/II-fold pyridoxal phosphate-dependent enzyme [Pseudomonadota bacterium]